MLRFGKVEPEHLFPFGRANHLDPAAHYDH